MFVQTKKRFKNLGKIIGIALFALLMFTNIKVALMDDAEFMKGNISIMGFEIELFQPSYAGPTDYTSYCLDNCYWQPYLGRCRPSGWEAKCLGMCQPLLSSECIFLNGW